MTMFLAACYTLVTVRTKCIFHVIKCNSELQIRGGIEDNLKIIFLFLNVNIFCDPSLEPSRRDGSNEGSQNMFLWRHMGNYL